jgi:acetyl esterase/lipase
MSFAESVTLERDIVFNQDPTRPLRLHLLRPRPARNRAAPCLVFVHGGGFRTGSRDHGIEPLTPFAARGYVCASLEYRFSSEALWPAQIEDVKCGVRFLRANAGALGIESDHIGAWGHSAGGHLVSMLGVTDGEDDLEGTGGWADTSSRVQAVCNWFGPTDFLQMNRAGSTYDHDAPDSSESALIGAPIQSAPERAARANPISYIQPGRRIPPFLIVHGDADLLVPFNQSELLAAALERVDANVRLVRLAGAAHGGPDFHTQEISDLVAGFFTEHLEQPG